MDSPFSVLGIAATSHAREVKRAYAAKLKQSRPDDDPAEFQRLHEAYEAALQWAAYLRDQEANELVDQSEAPTLRKPIEESETKDENVLDEHKVPYFSVSTRILPLASEPQLEPDALANPVRDFAPRQPVVVRDRADDMPVGSIHHTQLNSTVEPEPKPDAYPRAPAREFALDRKLTAEISPAQVRATPVHVDELEIISDERIALWLQQFRLTEHASAESAYAQLQSEAMFQSLAAREHLEAFAQDSLESRDPWHWTALLAFEKSFDWYVVGNLPPANVQQQLSYAHMFHRLLQVPAPNSRFARSDDAMTYRLMRPLSRGDLYLLPLLPGAGPAAVRVFGWLRESGFEPSSVLNPDQHDFWSRIYSEESSWLKYGISMWRIVFVCFLLSLIPGLTARSPSLMAMTFFGLSLNAVQVGTVVYLVLHGVRWLRNLLSRGHRAKP